MKLQIIFNQAEPDGSLKKRTLTFSNLNQSASNDNMRKFVLAIINLMSDVSDVEIYLIKRTRI